MFLLPPDPLNFGCGALFGNDDDDDDDDDSAYHSFHTPISPFHLPNPDIYPNTAN